MICWFDYSCAPHKFRLFPFRSPLLGESHWFLFLALIRCFSSRCHPPQSYITHTPFTKSKLTLCEYPILQMSNFQLSNRYWFIGIYLKLVFIGIIPQQLQSVKLRIYEHCVSYFYSGFSLRRDCSIRTTPDQRFIAPHRRVSPLYASFLGQNLLGIHYQHYE